MLTLELPKLKSSELMERMASLDVFGIPWKSLPKQISTLLIPKVKSYASKTDPPNFNENGVELILGSGGI